MKIQEVKNAFKIATTEIIGNKVCINYLDKIYDENGKELSKSILRENVARVYFIVVDDEIYKIGGSQDNNGMKGTLNIYQTGGVNGRPSIRSYGIYKLLYKTLKSNKRIKVIRYRVNWFNLAILIVATGIVLRLLIYLVNSI